MCLYLHGWFPSQALSDSESWILEFVTPERSKSKSGQGGDLWLQRLHSIFGTHYLLKLGWSQVSIRLRRTENLVNGSCFWWHLLTSWLFLYACVCVSVCWSFFSAHWTLCVINPFIIVINHYYHLHPWRYCVVIGMDLIDRRETHVTTMTLQSAPPSKQSWLAVSQRIWNSRIQMIHCIKISVSIAAVFYSIYFVKTTKKG